MKIASFALLLLGSYLAAGLFLLLSLDRLMYYPRKGLDGVPGDFGLDGEEVSFPSSDGTPLHGWYFPRAGSRTVLLFLHGNGGNISHRLSAVRQLLRAPADVFLFDYRGYGLSGGEAKGVKPLLDAAAALETLRSRVAGEGKRIVLFGESIGGSMALILASKEKVDGVVAMAAFTSTRDVARSMPLYWLFSFILPERYDAIGALKRVEAPLLVIHGTEDEIIPFRHGEEIYAAASGRKENFWVRGGRHNDLFDVAGIEIVQRVADFVEKL
jgi:pimeloyl-ACP methyl ester carboxylesterase